MSGVIGSEGRYIQPGGQPYLRHVESLAYQLKDALLFEKARRASWGELNSAACVDIARVYLESGDAQTALGWVECIPEGETFRAHARDELLLEIHRQLGNQTQREEVAWRLFRRGRSKTSLKELLVAVGEERRNEVIAGEVETIMADRVISLGDARFLIDHGRSEQAEAYLLERAYQLDGRFYDALRALAKSLEEEDRPLAATLLYRALLDSILQRSYTKAYSHGARYLKKLDRLAEAVTDWRGLAGHTECKEQLRAAHGRKRSFWDRYEG